MFYLPVEDAASCFIPPCAETCFFHLNELNLNIRLVLENKELSTLLLSLTMFLCIGGEVGKKRLSFTLLTPSSSLSFVPSCVRAEWRRARASVKGNWRWQVIVGRRQTPPALTSSPFVLFCLRSSDVSTSYSEAIFLSYSAEITRYNTLCTVCTQSPSRTVSNEKGNCAWFIYILEGRCAASSDESEHVSVCLCVALRNIRAN